MADKPEMTTEIAGRIDDEVGIRHRPGSAMVGEIDCRGFFCPSWGV
jgi:hypothetical protein